METLSSSETEAEFAVSTLLDYQSSNVKILTVDGLPLGFEDFSTLTFEPVLLSIDP